MVGTGEPGSITVPELTPALFFSMDESKRTLHIHFDEVGDESEYSKDNPIYAVVFVMEENTNENDAPLESFSSKLKKMDGGDHFVQ